MIVVAGQLSERPQWRKRPRRSRPYSGEFCGQ